MQRLLSKEGPTFQALALVYLDGPTAISNLHPWLARAARVALRRGLVELVVDHDDVIAITDAGRARLGLPAPGALLGRDPVAILNAAQVAVYGHIRYRLLAAEGSADGSKLVGSKLVARVAGVEVSHPALRWYPEVVAAVAREHDVRCIASFDRAGRFWGFARA